MSIELFVSFTNKWKVIEWALTFCASLHCVRSNEWILNFTRSVCEGGLNVFRSCLIVVLLKKYFIL